MVNEIYEKIKASKKIIILRHQNPDGDAIGSQIGLKEALINTFPDKKVLVGGKMNEDFSYLGKMDYLTDEDFHNALVIVLDTSTSDIIDDDRFWMGEYLIKIDHHRAGLPYGDLNLVLENDISTSLIIAKLIFNAGYQINSLGAMALYTGIVTDSGRFRYQGVNAETFAICAKLLEYQFSIQEVYNHLYLEDLDVVRLKAQMTLKFKQIGSLAYLKTTYDEVSKTNLTVHSISRGMVSVMGGIRGIDVWVNFTENENGQVHAEIRSNKIDVSQIATAFGGGGHKLASGATLANFDEADLMIKNLLQLLENKNERD